MTFRIDGNNFNFPEGEPTGKPKGKPAKEKFDIGGALGKPKTEQFKLTPEQKAKLEEAIEEFKSGKIKPQDLRKFPGYETYPTSDTKQIKLTPEQEAMLQEMIQKLKSGEIKLEDLPKFPGYETYPKPDTKQIKLTPEQKAKLEEAIKEFKFGKIKPQNLPELKSINLEQYIKELTTNETEFTDADGNLKEGVSPKVALNDDGTLKKGWRVDENGQPHYQRPASTLLDDPGFYQPADNKPKKIIIDGKEYKIPENIDHGFYQQPSKSPDFMPDGKQIEKKTVYELKDGKLVDTGKVVLKVGNETVELSKSTISNDVKKMFGL